MPKPRPLTAKQTAALEARYSLEVTLLDGTVAAGQWISDAPAPRSSWVALEDGRVVEVADGRERLDGGRATAERDLALFAEALSAGVVVAARDLRAGDRIVVLGKLGAQHVNASSRRVHVDGRVVEEVGVSGRDVYVRCVGSSSKLYDFGNIVWAGVVTILRPPAPAEAAA